MWSHRNQFVLTLRNPMALEALHVALTQFIQNTEDIEDELEDGSNDLEMLKEARLMQTEIDKYYIGLAG